ncbi:MAG: glycosyltransferase [Muribaculaceae bacterium]|nr:glycosyltransferase [Muribaculaceae bacterium]
MKILIVNKFFYPRGGDCVVAMATRRLLQEMGHEVRVFAMNHPDNVDIEDVSGYATEVSFAGGMKSKIAGARRIFGKGDIVESAARVLDDFRPDVVHLHNVHSYLSPVIGEMAAKRGIRVVWTLHDYKLLCPSYACRRPGGELCEECFHGGLRVVHNRCMKGSLVQSVMADLESRSWNRARLSRFTSCFIAPSQFMRNKMLEGGYGAHKVIALHNFIDPEKSASLARGAQNKERDYFCYVGRLSEEKGVETLLKGVNDSGVRFKVGGDGPLSEELRTKYSDNPNIEFLGQLDADGVVKLLSGAKASVIPSECYENNPLSVIESLCAGTPVIGASIGGIPELITEKDGILFHPGNAEEIGRILKDFGKRHPFDNEAISRRALEQFSRDRHYAELMKIYSGDLTVK